ncbi:MAG TPA: SdpI family protein [Candidatus Scatomorpha pullistercoris]|uniref:SdpI family protein n=1 Tax=Candidatus Scatomorpha pullistercoris TaxID=2840929 RepID=A0A9D1G4X1_9FIRM|nr:SdpI family protein [Candidatus Scatomorpha pullistercoris]
MRKLTERDILILELIFCGLPLAYYLLRLPLMPETVPVHWNASGEADRFAGRFSFDMLFTSVTGYLGLLFGIGLRRLICSISKSESQQNAATVERIMKWTQAFMCLLFTGMSLYYVNHITLSKTPGSDFIMKLGGVVIGLVLIVTGNQLPKLRRNGTSGARTKYSMSSDEAWQRTQRYAGCVMILAGVALLAVSLLPSMTTGAAAAAIAAALIAVVVPVVLYRGGKNQR